jgi:hypothetical protein
MVHKLFYVTSYRMECFAVNGPNADILVCGSSEGTVYFVTLPELNCLRIVDVTANGAVRSLKFSEGIYLLMPFCSSCYFLTYFCLDNQYLMIGSQNGTLSICVDVGKTAVEAQPSMI